MWLLPPGAELGCHLPRLQILAIDELFELVDIGSGTWEIQDSLGVLVDGPFVIDVDDCPAGDRLGIGQYAVPWTVGGPGLYALHWDTDVGQGSSTFEVVEGLTSPLESYATVASLRCEGFPSSISNAFLAQRLALARAQIDRWTGSHFAPVAKDVNMTGPGSKLLLLREPIIAISTLAVEFSDAEDPDEIEVALDDVRVFNRHIRQGLISPDDRQNPKLERISGIFPRRPQNVLIRGVFGNTEPDGSRLGATPMEIAHAARLMVARNRDKVASGQRIARQSQHLLREERTIDQQRKYDRPAEMSSALGRMTGDPEIDSILGDPRYRRPFAIR